MDFQKTGGFGGVYFHYQLLLTVSKFMIYY